MISHNLTIAVLGLGEAGSHFANDLVKMGVNVVGYDPNPVRPLSPLVAIKTSNAEVVQGADVIFSANLSSVSEEIAYEVAAVLRPQQFFCEMNTSGPDKKKKIASILAPSGVKIVDLAIMAPVPPKGILTPFLASGPFAAELIETLAPLQLDLHHIPDSQIGDAATRKLLRSIVYKGIAAVVCEAMEAGQVFGMESYIRGQISSLIGGGDDLVDRFVEGSRTHAVRRMHEMEAVMEMLAAPPMGESIRPIMTTATKDNLKRLAQIGKKEIPPSGARGLPYFQIRGGSSKGLFFRAEDLPTDEQERNNLLLLAMEGTTEGDPRQIDGLGGATSLTSKVAIVSKSTQTDAGGSPADLDYLFVQVVVGKGKVSTTQTCGNMLAGVLPFAIESGLFPATSPTTTAKINIVNTGGICEVTVPSPNGQVEYHGTTKVDGVPGTASRIVCNYLDTVGSTCGALLPTGNSRDTIDGIEATCIDNGMPIVVMRAHDFGLIGNESKEVLEANEPLKKRIEAIRLKAGFLMNLGDVSQQTIPKMCLVSPPENGGAINTRMFIPHVVHEAIGVLAAVSVATACVIPGTVIGKMSGEMRDESGVINDSSLITHLSSPISHHSSLSIEHPSGEFTVSLEYGFVNGQLNVYKSGVIRTARLLSKGEVFLPY